MWFCCFDSGSGFFFVGLFGVFEQFEWLYLFCCDVGCVVVWGLGVLVFGQ